ncbi:hypothetical protein FB476_1666 [Ornithinimicrobium humiphilum]|uniref:Uncharacterized protein n=1 Tax=Ornithinimicrobium humiphilum TaxID=125288 RepID=A0A543KNX6_9MICO|nr:hypothetical protein FB476_1666 [Ornithinimicrobium humiphilum]
MAFCGASVVDHATPAPYRRGVHTVHTSHTNPIVHISEEDR